MRPIIVLTAVLLVTLPGAARQQPPRDTARPSVAGARLDDLTWPEAEQRLRAGTVVVLPLGAGSQQHGPHLPLRTDQILVDYLTRRVLETSDVLVAPAVPYHHYPAFAEYPGSTSLSLATARDLTADAARSLAAHGPRRFYVLNVDTFTNEATEAAAKALASEGILLRTTNARVRLDAAARPITRQSAGAHADEIETSMMLYVQPSAVDMTRAVRESAAPPSNPFRLTRRMGGRGTFSSSGVWGDATLATGEKGRVLIDALLAGIRSDIEDTRAAQLPSGGTSGGAGGGRGPSASDRFGARPGECTEGDERAIRALGPAFSSAWLQKAALRIASFWAEDGDMMHPDGYVEGSQQVIRENRTSLFMRPEYRGSLHPLTVGQIRCLAPDIAVADAKWELRNVVDANRQPVPPTEGFSTLILRRTAGRWRIEAYRYNVSTPQTTNRPTLLDRPAGPGK